jgi:K+-sensing histidine kinase KdpD
VVILSALETADLIAGASEAGAGGYLTKPLRANDMARAMRMAIARHDDLMELRRVNQELKAHNEDLDAFADAVAHDLRNPTALLIGFAEALRKYRDTMSPEDFLVSLENIEQSGWRINEILDRLSLLGQARKLDAKYEPLDTATIVSNAQEHLASVIKEHDARIILPDSWPVALGQALWVEEVWVCLLQKAIRHSTGRPPTLKLDATVLPDSMVQFRIKDDGDRVEGDEQEPLFDPLPLRRKRKGLGISVARRILAKLGGEIEIESDDGKTLYGFTLPGEEFFG